MRYHFLLFIVNKTETSLQAKKNFHLFCDHYIEEEFHIEVIDIFKYPQQASNYQIIATPTLIRCFPKPEIRLIDNLDDIIKLMPLLHFIQN